MAYVEWRGGRWQVQVRTTGRRQEWHDLSREIGPDQHELAKAVGSGVAEQVRKGKSVPSERGETVREWYDRWLAWRKKRGDGDIDKIGQRFEIYLAEPLGALPIRSVRRDQLKAIVADLDRRVTAGEIAWKTATNIWSQCVSRAFKDAADGKEPSLCVLSENPATGVRAPDRGARVRKQYLYPEEALQLLASEDVPLSRRRLYAFAIYTYMRAGEIAALRWDDVDVERGIIHVHQSMDRVVKKGVVSSTKGDEDRRIVLEPALRPLIEAMHQARTSPMVFPDLPPAHGSDGQAPTLRADIARAQVSRSALLQRPETRTRKWMTFHDLRATGVTWAAIRGDDALKIMSRSGHTQYQTMLLYVREAEVVREGFGAVFPPLPAALVARPQIGPMAPRNTAKTSKKKRPQGDSNAGVEAREIAANVGETTRADGAPGPVGRPFAGGTEPALTVAGDAELAEVALRFIEAVAAGDAVLAEALQARLGLLFVSSRMRALDLAERLVLESRAVPAGGGRRETA